MTLPKDPIKAKEYRVKQSENNKGRPRTEETRKKISTALKGMPKSPFTKEHRKHIGEAQKGRVLSKSHRKKIADANRGKKRSEGTCTRMRESWLLRKPMSEETRNKVSASIKKLFENKENHPCWLGGRSFEPYCPKFNDEFRERVRAFFGYQCQECGRVWHEGERKFAVHHVNFNKESCCAKDVIPLFVPLCQSCHAKTGFNRVFWEYWFTEMINRLYCGKCYIPKEK
jgi:hypothetical protein